MAGFMCRFYSHGADYWRFPTPSRQLVFWWTSPALKGAIHVNQLHSPWIAELRSIGFSPPGGIASDNRDTTVMAMATSYNWLFRWDYTFYKWGFVSTYN